MQGPLARGLKSGAVMSFVYSTTNPCRVLIADRSSAVRSLVRRVLECAGSVFIIDETSDMNTTLKRAEADPIHLAYIGSNIASSNGLSVVQDIAKRCSDMRTVLMVEHITADLLRKGRIAGVGTFLAKPFYPAQVEHAFDLVFDEMDARSFEPLDVADLEREMVPSVPDEAAYADFRKAAQG